MLIIIKIIRGIWPPARRRVREALAAREQAEAEAQRQAEQAKKARQEAEDRAQGAYDAHVKNVDLNGVFECRQRGPLKLSELLEEVQKRLDLARAVKRNPQIMVADQMSDEDIEKIMKKLDQTALAALTSFDDPSSQRRGADKVRQSRFDLDDHMPLDRYATIVGEAIARSSAKFRPSRILVAVRIRAVLMRSADPRWSKQKRNALPALSDLPYR